MGKKRNFNGSLPQELENWLQLYIKILATHKSSNIDSLPDNHYIFIVEGSARYYYTIGFLKARAFDFIRENLCMKDDVSGMYRVLECKITDEGEVWEIQFKR